MRKGRVAIVGFGLIVLLIVTVLLVREPATPVALIRLVDGGGKPVAGATVTPDGLRPKNDGSHYGWEESRTVKPHPVISNGGGVAPLPYPFYLEEKLETGGITFSVDHPNFCPHSADVVVDPSPPLNAKFKSKVKYWWQRLVTGQITVQVKPIVLQRGGVLELRAVLTSADPAITNIAPQLNRSSGTHRDFWEQTNSGYVSKRVTPGTNRVRMIGFRALGRVYFSDAVEFVSVPDQTNQIQLPLKAGLRLRGHLDDSVPRPVLNGRVLARVFSPSAQAEDELTWMAWRPLSSEGTFEFDSLPSGELNVVAICDGYVSRNDRLGTFAPSRRTPQVFPLADQDLDIVIAMERSATFEATVLDDGGLPLRNAEISFWPNIVWSTRGSSIFAANLINSEEVFRSNSTPNWRNVWRDEPRWFRAITDENGFARVTNLPPYSGRESFDVGHSNYELPVARTGTGIRHRYQETDLVSGETNRLTIRMQKKGTEFVEHPR